MSAVIRQGDLGDDKGKPLGSPIQLVRRSPLEKFRGNRFLCIYLLYCMAQSLLLKVIRSHETNKGRWYVFFFSTKKYDR